MRQVSVITKIKNIWLHTYQMADKCSDYLVYVVLENSAFVASNFDCNNFVTYCLDDCIVAVRIVAVASKKQQTYQLWRNPIWYQRSPNRYSENRNQQGTGKYRRMTTLRDSGRKIRRYGR
jgi:hypothetical protein